MNKVIKSIVLIVIIGVTIMMSGCTEMEIGCVELVRIESIPTTISDPISDPKMRLVLPARAKFNLYGDDGREYSATLSLHENTHVTMSMRSDEGNIIWHASWEDISINDDHKIYRIHGRDMIIGFFKDGSALYKVDDDEEYIVGRWSDSAMYE